MSTPIQLPVVKVTVLEDRALVERRGDVALPAGPQRLRVEGLSPLAVDRSLQAQLAGGSVAQARVSRTWKEKAREAHRERKTQLHRRVEDLEAEWKRAQADVHRLQARLEVVNVAREEVLRAIAELAGVGRAKLESWHEQLATVRKEVSSTDEALRQARGHLEKTRQRLVEAQEARSRGELPETELVTAAELEANLPQGGTVSLCVTYLVPCAVWRPAYRATLAPAEGGEEVTLECEAVVWQRTEEEWSEVELQFSTARPTLGASPPRLVEDADAAGVALLPGIGDLEPECDCGVWDHCPHTAALSYQLARLLDQDPHLLLLMRGRDEGTLLEEVQRRSAALAERAARAGGTAPPAGRGPAGVPAGEAYALGAILPPLPDAPPLPAEPGGPASLSGGTPPEPGVDAAALEFLAARTAVAARRLLAEALAPGHADTAVPAPLTRWQDAVRLAAARPGADYWPTSRKAS